MGVRLEKVILDLDDKFSGPAARAAASAALLNKHVSDLDKSGKTAGRSLSGDATRGVTTFGRSADQSGRSIDRFSGRLRLLADAAAILGPGLVPIGAIGIPAVAGLANQMGAAAIAGGTLVAAFQGVGTALEAVNKAAIDPTEANLKNARIAMQQLGPAAREFVNEFQDMRPVFAGIRDAAAAGWFPGLIEAMGEIEGMAPRIAGIFQSIGTTGGGLVAEGAASLAGPRWDEFLSFVETEVPRALADLWHTVGNLTHGLAELWMAFTPLNNDFSDWMLDVSASFDDWAEGLAQTDGFQEFIAYLRESGPQVADALGALAGAVLDIAVAAAPLGGPVLAGIEAFSKAVSAIAESDLGTPIMAGVAALSLFNRGAQLMAATGAAGWAANIRGANGTVAAMSAARTAMRGAAGGAGLLALSLTDVDDKAGLSQAAMGAMAGMMVGGVWGAGIGGAIGLTMDFADANDDLGQAAERAAAAVGRSLDVQRSAARSLRSELSETSSAGDASNFWSMDMGDNLAFFGAQWSNLTGETDKARKALSDVESSLHMSDSLSMLFGPLGHTADAFDVAAMSADDFHRSVTRAFAALDKRAALRATRAALRDFNEAMGDSPKNMRRGSKAYDEVEEALDNVARSSLEAAEHLKGMNRVDFLERQRGQFVDAAQKLGMTRRQARALADDLGLVDRTEARPKIDPDDRTVRPKINATDNLLKMLGGKEVRPGVIVDSNAATIAAQTNAILSSIPDEIVTLRTVRTGAGGQGGGYDGAAGGTTVPKSGRGYADRFPYLLADGEEVISNRFGQADKHRQLLKAINANRLADGGTTGAERRQFSAGWGGGSSSSRTVERIIERLPDTLQIDAGELGVIVIDTVDGRIGDHRAHDSRQAATMWAGVTND